MDELTDLQKIMIDRDACKHVLKIKNAEIDQLKTELAKANNKIAVAREGLRAADGLIDCCRSDIEAVKLEIKLLKEGS